MRTSGAETLSVSANIFVGQTEAPLMIRPYVGGMTKSELVAVMVGGFATAAGGVLAIYAKWLDGIPGIAGHLMSASVMSAPAALVIAKIIYPETKKTQSITSEIKSGQTTINAMDALGTGTVVGLKLAVNVGAMLISFISIIALLNYFLSIFGFSIESVLGLIFSPLAWPMLIPPKDWDNLSAGDIKSVNQSVEEDRKFWVQACIARIMKSLKEATYSTLIQRIHSEAANRFQERRKI